MDMQRRGKKGLIGLLITALLGCGERVGTADPSRRNKPCGGDGERTLGEDYGLLIRHSAHCE
ncbi:MAG: hypothetical protein AAF471_07300 [Myxococcota bacterium]